MNIVFVDDVLTVPPTGGAHTFLVELCTALAARGNCVSVVTKPGPDHALVDAMRMADVEVYDNVWRAVDLPEERAALLADWVNSRADVYVISISADAGWLALPLLDVHVATASVVHSDGPTFYEPLKHYQAFLDVAVGVSRETVRKIVAYCGVSADRARQIPYGVSSLTRPQMQSRQTASLNYDGPLRAGYVGRLVTSQKRVLDLIPLAKEMRRRDLNFALHLIGDGPERVPLEEGFRAEALEEYVKFWGWLSPDEVRDRLQQLDALVLVSDCEGLPVAMLEAMGQGAVPLATRIESGTGELIQEGINGFLADVGDFSAFAQNFITLTRDRKLLASMSWAAWETSQEYTVERMVERYLKAFAEVKQMGASPARQAAGHSDYPVMPSCVSRYPYWLRKLKRRMLVAAGRAR